MDKNRLCIQSKAINSKCLLRKNLYILHTHLVCLWSRQAPPRCAGLENSSSHWTPLSCPCDVLNHTHSPGPPTVKQGGVEEGKRGDRTYFFFNRANLALYCDSAFPNRACKISCVMHLSLWWLCHAVRRLVWKIQPMSLAVWMKVKTVFKNGLQQQAQLCLTPCICGQRDHSSQVTGALLYTSVKQQRSSQTFCVAFFWCIWATRFIFPMYMIVINSEWPMVSREAV